MNALAAASRSDVSPLSVRMVDTVGSSKQAAAGRGSKPGDEGLRKIAKREEVKKQRSEEMTYERDMVSV